MKTNYHRYGLNGPKSMRFLALLSFTFSLLDLIGLIGLLIFDRQLLKQWLIDYLLLLIVLLICSGLSLIYLHTVLVSQPKIWHQTLDQLDIDRTKRLLVVRPNDDRGALLIQLSQRLNRQKLVGLAKWQPSTQTLVEQNIQAAQIDKKIVLQIGDFLDYTTLVEQYDLIVCNLTFSDVRGDAAIIGLRNLAERVTRNRGQLVIYNAGYFSQRMLNKQLRRFRFRDIQIKPQGLQGLWGVLPSYITIASK